jgi:hypothetical protein
LLHRVVFCPTSIDIEESATSIAPTAGQQRILRLSSDEEPADDPGGLTFAFDLAFLPNGANHHAILLTFIT